MKKGRNVYLNMKTLAEARKILFDSFSLTDVLQTEVVPVSESIGRVLAEPVLAKVSSPNFNAAAMDGIAVKAEVTFGASQTTPKKLSINHDAFYVNTGHVMPVDTDAVIMIESKRRCFHGNMFAKSARTLWPPNCFFRRTMSSHPIALGRCWRGEYFLYR
jgi:putative molybdopterin biosynthesis protein